MLVKNNINNRGFVLKSRRAAVLFKIIMNKSKIRIFNTKFSGNSKERPYFSKLHHLQYWLKQKGLCYNIFWL